MKQVIECLLSVVAAVFAAMAFADSPTMGWSSWNTYRVHISDKLIMSQADALVEQGLDKVGFNHINIDDGYFGGRDKETDKLITHPERFPDGLKPVVEHIHAKGLKAGIYSDGGSNTCGSFFDKDVLGIGVGFYNHDQLDADFFFKELGFDFIKIDFCGGCARSNFDKLQLDERIRYSAIAEAIAATGRKDVRMNICRWDFPGTWAHDVGFSWRISKDICPNWVSVRDIIRESLCLAPYCWGGRYNDMDMLEVGRGMSAEEDKTHFGMWCIMSSPLLIGCDLTKLKPETLKLLKNRDLIALNQDRLGLQAGVVKRIGRHGFVLAKDLETDFGPQVAVAFYNESDAALAMDIDLAQLGLVGKTAVRDCFENVDLAPIAGTLSAEVPAHGCRIYRLKAEGRSEPDCYPAEAAWLGSYQELEDAKKANTAYYTPHCVKRDMMVAMNVGGNKDDYMMWRRVWSEKGGEYRLRVETGYGKVGCEVRVNGAKIGVVDPVAKAFEFKAVLKPGLNQVSLHNDEAKMVDIHGLRLSK